MRISEIRNSQQFQDLCQLLLAAEYSDFQALDDSSGDKGSDGYVPSIGRLFAIYCPEKHPTPKAYFQRKIRSDLAKAVALRDKYKYQINEWIFITPAPLTEELHRYISQQVKEVSLTKGISWSEKNLVPILQRHSELESLLPDLFTADLMREIQTGITNILAGQTAAKSSVDAQIKEWLGTLDRFLEEKQINSSDYSSIFEQVLDRDVHPNSADRHQIESALVRCKDIEKKLYWSFSDEEIMNRVVRIDQMRVHQILTALRFKLQLRVMSLNVWFTLIPPGTAQDGFVNRTHFYIAENVLTESEWDRILGNKSTNGRSHGYRPRLNLSIESVRQFLVRANHELRGTNGELSQMWRMPTTENWLFMLAATGTRDSFPVASTLGVRDLVGRVWQFCQSSEGDIEVRGGSLDVPIVRVTCTDLADEDWGFRPTLELLQKSAQRTG